MSTEQRDLAATRAGFERWLATQWPDASDLRVAPIETTGSSGFSSETLFVEAAYTEGGDARVARLVARLPPLGNGLFPTYDLEAQYRVQEIVAGQGLPIAPLIGYEADPAWVGTPFLLMGRVDGLVPLDMPAYYADGWLHDASAADQQLVCASSIETLAALHHIDVDGAGLSFLQREQGPGLTGELAWWREYADWGTDGSPPAPLTELHDWLAAHRPTPSHPDGLVWGDARLGNMMYGPDCRPVAILDWEMACLGPAECDLAFFLAVRRMIRDLAGVADPELPGLPDFDGTVAAYEAAAGRAVEDMDWYLLFAMFRTGTIVARMESLFQGMGMEITLDSVPEWVRVKAGIG